MGNLLRAEIYKTGHRKALGICLAFTIIIELLNSFLHGGNQVDTMALLIEIIGLITCVLYAGLSIGNDFSSRTIFHTVTSGKSRFCVWISKYLSYFAVCFLLLLVNTLAINGGVLLFHRGDAVISANALPSIFVYSCAGILYDLCLVSLFFFITMQVKDSGISIAVCTVLAGGIISNSKLLWVDRLFPLFSTQTVMNDIPTCNFLMVLLVPWAVLVFGVLLFRKRDL